MFSKEFVVELMDQLNAFKDFSINLLIELNRDYDLTIIGFVCSIFIAGIFTYLISFKRQTPKFQQTISPKKKSKKSKQSTPQPKIKQVQPKLVPKYVERKTEPTVKSATLVLDEQVEDVNGNWTEVKSKRSMGKGEVKPVEKIIKVKEIVIEPHVEDAKEEPVEMEKKEEITVTEPPCEPGIHEESAPETPVEVPVEMSVPTAPEEEQVESLDRQVTPTSSDDFELIEMQATSSNEEMEADTINSYTSGASRKKNKRQQKLVAAQLKEAADLETNNSASLPEKTSSIQPTAASQFKLVSVKRKKRSRKDY